MAIQLNTTLRNNMISQYESTIGTTPKLILRSGTQPANAAAADSGTLLAIITLPSDWATQSNGTLSIANGPWSGVGVAAGTIGHFRLKDATATSTDNTGTTYEQGSVTATGSGGDLIVDNTSIAVDQTVNVTTWTRTQGGA
jgi:hypothetical protein